MNIKIKSIYLIVIAVLLLSTPLIWYVWYHYEDSIAEKRNFNMQLGVYQLDINKTDLKSYKSDSLLYKKLRITFNDDATFQMNMKVPFIYDSVGKWNAGGGDYEDWNYLYYRNWGYSKYEKNVGDPFTQPTIPDSIFYMNSTTPQQNQDALQRIYFKKIRQ